MRTDSFDKVFEGKNRVMSIMPHPDDTELYCAGTLARLLAQGKEVITVKLTNGGKGTQQSALTEAELSTIRAREDQQAAEQLGLRPGSNIQMGWPDGELDNDLATIEQLALLIRQYRPDVIITTNPEDVIIRFDQAASWINHRDHRMTGQLAIDAAYPYSLDTAFFPHQLEGLTEPYKPTPKFLLGDFWDHQDTVHIDVTDFLEPKLKAWRCHKSAYTPERIMEELNWLNKDGSRYYEPFRVV